MLRSKALALFGAVAALGWGGMAALTPSAANAAPQTTFWAVVNSSGTLVRGNGATAASNISTGTYQVTFSADMSNCTYEATAGDPAAGAVAGPVQVTVATRAGNPAALFLQTFDQTTGLLANQPFHVATYCGAKQLGGVVDSSGVLARGANITSSAHLSAGSYEVLFKKTVKACTFNATIGTTSTGSVPNPGLITVAGRSGNKKGVFVRIVDRSGNSLDSPFHIELLCGKKPLTAVVGSDGTLARGGAATLSAAKLGGTGTGTYQVVFNRTVSGCAYTATVGTTTQGGSISTPVDVTTATRAGNASAVFLFVHQSNGSTIDEPFHLIVQC